MKSLFLGIIGLAIWGSILLFGIAAYVIHKHPQQVTHEITNRLSKEFKDITISIESFRLVFSPLPKIRLKNIIIETIHNDTFYFKKCFIAPDISQLIKGKINFSSIQIINPLITLRSSTVPINYLNLTSDIINTSLNYLSGVDISIKNGTLLVYEKNKALLDISDFNCNFHLSPQNITNITLNIANIDCNNLLPTTLKKQLSNLTCSIKNTHIHIKNLQLTPLPLDTDNYTLDIYKWITNFGATNFEFSTLISIDKLHELMITSNTTTIQTMPNNTLLIKGQIEADGHVCLNNAPILTKLYLPFSVEFTKPNKDFPEISIHKAQLKLDTSNCYFYGTVKNYTKLKNILFDGTVQIKKLNLLDFFDFAQELPNGLQNALKHLSGMIQLSTTPQKIYAKELYIKLLDAKLYGTGEIADISQPNIKIDLKTDTLDINHIFPEIKGTKPTQYAQIQEKQKTVPIVPLKDTSKNTSIHYDIHIHAKNAYFWNFQGKDFFFSIQPDGNNIKLTANYKNFYNGSLTSSLTISDTNMYTISMNFINIQLKKPMELITKYPLSGVVNGTITLHGKKEQPIKKFLSNLNSTINLHIKNGVLGPLNEENTPFSHLYINCTTTGIGTEISSEKPLHNTIYDGHWNIALLSPTYNVSLTMNGPLFFSTQTWLPNQANNIPSCMTFSKPNTPVLQMNGNLSFDLNSMLFTFTNFSNPKKTTQFSGTIHINNKSTFDGSLNITTSEPSKVLTQLGYAPTINIQKIQHADLKGNFSISPATIQISDTYGTIGHTSFNFSLDVLKTTPLAMKGELNIESLNLEKYLTNSHSHNINIKTPWSIELLKHANIEGTIKIKDFSYNLFKYKELTIPVNLKEGILSLTPITTSFYEGPTNASITIKALEDGSAAINVHYISKNIDMLNLTQKHDQPYIISGLAVLSLDLKTTGSSKKDLIENAQGTLRLIIQDGIFKRKTAKATRKFSILSSDGIINKGILITEEATLTGPGLAIKGSGSIDFPKWTIDYNITFDTNSIPHPIPIHYFGDLSNPQYTVNTTSFILGTLGTLGIDTLNIIENVILTPIKIFLP